MFERIGLELKALKGYGPNSNVRKERAVILMFERIGTKSNIKKNRARNPTSERRGPEFQC